MAGSRRKECYDGWMDELDDDEDSRHLILHISVVRYRESVIVSRSYILGSNGSL